MKFIRIKSLLLGLSLVICCSGFAAEPVAEGNESGSRESDWPSFRGFGAKGVADGYALPDSWNVDAEEGEVTGVLWRVEVPGLGHSSPVVSGNQVLIATAIAESPPGLFSRPEGFRLHQNHAPANARQRGRQRSLRIQRERVLTCETASGRNSCGRAGGVSLCRQRVKAPEC